MNSLFKLKFKMHKLVNIIFYLIIFVLGFFVGLTINSVSAEELETKNTHIVCRDSKNLFDPNTGVVLINSYYSHTDGNIYKETGYNGFKIPVQPNKKYVISTDATNFSNIVFWDDNFNFKEGLAGNLVHNINVPEGVYFITLAIKNDYTFFQIEQGEIATAYEPYGKQICEVIISDDNMFYDISKNIVGELDLKDFWVYDIVTCFLAISGITILVIVVLSIFKFFIRG